MKRMAIFFFSLFLSGALYAVGSGGDGDMGGGSGAAPAEMKSAQDWYAAGYTASQAERKPLGIWCLGFDGTIPSVGLLAGQRELNALALFFPLLPLRCLRLFAGLKTAAQAKRPLLTSKGNCA